MCVRRCGGRGCMRERGSVRERFCDREKVCETMG